MNEELIKRIDEWLAEILPDDLAELLQDCRAALSRKYVPMTEAEFDEISAQWPGEDEVKIYCWEKHIEREVIRRAGLEVVE